MSMLSRWSSPAGAITTAPWRNLDEFLQAAFGNFDLLHPELMNDCDCAGKLQLELKEKRVEAMLPVVGCTPENFEVEVVGDYLTIKVHRNINQPIEGNGLHFLRRERSFAEFESSVKLPAKVKGAAAEASYKDGILYVSIPREEESEPKKLVIKVK